MSFSKKVLDSVAQHHLTSLPTEYKWGKRRSTLVGVSCLMFVLPGICVWPLCRKEALLWFSCAVTSTASDYFYSGYRERPFDRMVHYCDKWLASVTLLWVIVSISMQTAGRDWNALGVGVLLVVASLYCLVHSRTAQTFEQRNLWHSLWHAVATCGRAGFVMAFGF
uniref:Uncharacterized protein n=1 Tax=Chromera velia CCMP2878 TaxID=1169474 RepID=A0A0G4FTN3_9ALVE|eukprot:Cvel_18576.t1-p1 / transcript=Cvel_18576.t1 / gene=Cvel_18576 / organism=Chromera_velia_CCMP2878 / gene_product=hypothetical protein / transcript_product=hypothetical protein / location=Cvel_scaffold1549:1246-1985(-) / protein_length=165 / sequence_SO=supercontig / SO=protein_coding / is_pseudo=false